MAQLGITIETRFDVSNERLGELVDGLSALLHGCGDGKGTDGATEARVTLQLFPHEEDGVRNQAEATEGRFIRVWRARGK